jgi:hypothetical protein
MAWNIQPRTRLAPFAAQQPIPTDPLVYTAPPRTQRVKEPGQTELTKYYVYHPTITKVGSADVVVAGSNRVVYMTPAAAKNFLSAFLIGNVPWSTLPLATRQQASQFSGGNQPPDRAPIVQSALVNQSASVGTGKAYQFATGSFVDPDNSSAALTSSAYKSGGEPLPAWMTFNASNRTFAISALTGNQGTYVFTVKATDPWGQYATSNWTLTVT